MSVYLTDVKFYHFQMMKNKSTRESIDAINKKIKVKQTVVLTEKLKKQQESAKLGTDKSNKLRVDILNNETLLLLNLSDNEDNKQINQCISQCALWGSKIIEMDAKQIKDDKNNDILIDNLEMVARDYYKREWEKAKRGK